MRLAVRGFERVVWRVKAESFDKCVAQLASILNITFPEPTIDQDVGVKTTISWEAGVEVVAPLDDQSRWAAIIAKKGEGIHSVVFGVDNLEVAVADAEATGCAVRARVEALTGESQVVKEAVLQTIFGGQIILAETVQK